MSTKLAAQQGESHFTDLGLYTWICNKGVTMLSLHYTHGFTTKVPQYALPTLHTWISNEGMAMVSRHYAHGFTTKLSQYAHPTLYTWFLQTNKIDQL